MAYRTPVGDVRAANARSGMLRHTNLLNESNETNATVSAIDDPKIYQYFTRTSSTGTRRYSIRSGSASNPSIT